MMRAIPALEGKLHVSTLAEICPGGWLIGGVGLLEEKGVKRDDDSHGTPEMPAGTGEKPPEKSSKLDKLKDKLHIGTGKHV